MTLLILFSWLLATRSDAEPLRIATWSLGGLTNGSIGSRSSQVGEERLQEAAALLKKAGLDMVILQQVPNEVACQKLADYLKPAQYQIAICSEFPGGDSSYHQLAILSRHPVLGVWSDNWRSVNSVDASRGYVFAAVKRGSQVIGVYSIELKDNSIKGPIDRATQLNILQRERAAEQLVREIGSISQRFKTSIDAFIVAGNFHTDPDESLFVSENTLQLFEEAGFANAFQSLPMERRIAAAGDDKLFDAPWPYVFGKNFGSAGDSRIQSPAVVGRSMIVVELNVKAPPVAVQTVPATSPYADPKTPWLVAGLFVLLSALCFLLWRWTRGNAETALVPAKLPNPDNVTSIIACPNCDEPIGVTPDASGTLQTALLPDLTDGSVRQEGFKELKPGDKSTTSMRERLIPHLARMMMDKLVRTLVFQRRDLLETQRKAATQVNQLEERLKRLPPQMQDRLRAYERRIAELEKDLAEKGEENRELILAQIVSVKKELAEEKSRNRLKWN